MAVTPNIGRLASEGVRYPNTFTAAGDCAASRAAGYYTWTDSKLDYQFSGPMRGSGPFTIWDREGGNEDDWRNRSPGQPVFGLVNFNITHKSGVFTPLGLWLTSFTHLLMPVMRAITLPSVPEYEPVKPSQVQVPPYYPDTATVRADMAHHYNDIAVMNQQVGEVLVNLEADDRQDTAGVKSNTPMIRVIE